MDYDDEIFEVVAEKTICPPMLLKQQECRRQRTFAIKEDAPSGTYYIRGYNRLPYDSTIVKPFVWEITI
jgi:hypothetical protein